MPVLGMNVTKRPCNAREIQPARYLRIFIDVILIIVVDEVVADGLTEDDPRNYCETDAHANSREATVRFRQSY